MLGAIIGDIVGSIYEFAHNVPKDFNLLQKGMRLTDDSLLTIAVAKTIVSNYPLSYDNESIKRFKTDLINNFVDMWKNNKRAGFGGRFYTWCSMVNAGLPSSPYNSYGNGSAMRVSPVGWVSNSIEEVKTLSKIVSEVTHNHIEGIKGAEAVSICIYLARNGYTKEQIKEVMINDYYPEIQSYESIESLKDTFTDSVTCQDTVPEAIYCFLESENLEDAIRNCVYLGGDCDTTGAMAGAIAEVYYHKDELSSLESEFLSVMIPSWAFDTIINFHKIIKSRKYNSLSQFLE